MIRDQGEAILPDIGLINLQDPETGLEFDVRADSIRIKKLLKDSLEQFEMKTKQIFNLAGVESLNVETSEEHAEKLVSFLKRRKTKR